MVIAMLGKQLIKYGLSPEKASAIQQLLALNHLAHANQTAIWQQLLLDHPPETLPFAAYLLCYQTIYPDYQNLPAPAWFPDGNTVKNNHITQWMAEDKHADYASFYQWSHTHYADFWEKIIKLLHIQFTKPYQQIVNIEKGLEFPIWFPDSQLNIASSCFTAQPDQLAIIEQNETGETHTLTYAELNQLSNRIANSIAKYVDPGDDIAIIMPMTALSVAIYLGIIKAGAVAVPIPESFSHQEVSTRLNIAKVKLIFIQDNILRDQKELALYSKIIKKDEPRAIVLPSGTASILRSQDLSWQAFLSGDTQNHTVARNAHDHATILFSSGTTGEPKAIIWSHVTPIKCGSDAYLHQNINQTDIVCWPTSLGWMMGAWSIYASFLNQATLALYNGTPNGKPFGQFVQDAKVTILGLVPTMVRTWRSTQCMENLDWRAISRFSSSGECSNVEDMLYLMWLARGNPVIEYCGGTEIGGAYLSSTLIQASAPGAFTSPTLGLAFTMLDEQGQETSNGEVAIIPPSIGLSLELLNKNHHNVYYQNMPKLANYPLLRRHGDQVERYANGFYRLHGRIDDTMNLKGIKISSAEIENALMGLAGLKEAAAIAMNPAGGGPSQLVIYAVLESKDKMNIEELKKMMQSRISQFLNPMFRIHEVILIDKLPRTASNKVMRRLLRDKKYNNDQP